MSTANIQIIDGYNGGVPHIEAAMIRDHNISLYGTGDYVLNVGNKFAHEIVDNNNITIKDGMAVIGGARCIIGYGKTLNAVIENGTSGYKRNDIIVLEYTLDNATLIETVSLKVVKGELGTTGVDPDLVTGDIRAGATVHQMALKRVSLDGLSISSVDNLWKSAVFTVPVGGTGKTTNTTNAILAGNGTSAVKNIASANGALYATAANGTPKFGTLPIAQGGTGKKTALEALLALGGTQIKKLWENASPTSSFANQTVNLDMTGYDLIKIQFNLDTNKRALPSFDSPTGRACFYESSGYTRHFAIDTNKITFTDASNAGAIIPNIIYGIKGVL